MEKNTDKAPTLGNMAINTLASTRMASATGKALLPKPTVISTLVSTRMADTVAEVSCLVRTALSKNLEFLKKGNLFVRKTLISQSFPRNEGAMQHLLPRGCLLKMND